MKIKIAFLLTLSLLLLTQEVKAQSIYCRLFNIGCPSTLPEFVPQYEKNPTLNNGFGQTFPLNPWYFATQDTATETCKRVVCLFVMTKPCSMGGGPATCSHVERYLVFDGNLQINAGLIASYWTRNPERAFPGLAQKLADMSVADERERVKK